MFDDWEKFDTLAEDYAKRFGERPPLMIMPADPAEQLALIRAAIVSGNPYQTDIPEDANI